MLGDEKDDIAKNLRITCRALITTADSKAAIFEEASNPKNGLSSYERVALWNGFFTRKSLAITKPFYSQFIAKVPDIADCGNKEFIDGYIENMCPRYDIDESYIADLNKLLKGFETKDAVKYESLIHLLKESIGTMEINLKVRNFARGK